MNEGGWMEEHEAPQPAFESCGNACGNRERSSHSCRPQIFIEDLRSAKHCSGHSGHSVE